MISRWDMYKLSKELSGHSLTNELSLALWVLELDSAMQLMNSAITGVKSAIGGTSTNREDERESLR